MLLTDGMFTILVGSMYALLGLALFLYFYAKDNLLFMTYFCSLSLIFSLPISLLYLIPSDRYPNYSIILINDLFGVGSIYYAPILITFLAVKRSKYHLKINKQILNGLLAAQSLALFMFLTAVFMQLTARISNDILLLFN